MTNPNQRLVHSADGTPIGATTIGSGPPVVFVHGAWNWHEQWLGVAEELEESHSAWVMDRRGRGSSGDGDDYSFDREIDDIAAVLDAAGLDACLLGHSSGAIYALEAAHRRGAERLILYEPPMRWTEEADPANMVDRFRALVDAGQAEQGAELFFREEGRLDEDELSFLKSLPVWEPMVALAPICLREWDAIIAAGLNIDRYAQLSTPTLLLAGSDNLDHPSMATEPLAETLSDVRTAVLNGHGHRAHLSDPALVAGQVRAFLGSGR